MDHKFRGPARAPFQFDLQNLFWLIFVSAILCVVVPGIFGFWPWLALGERAKHGDLNAPVILGIVVFAVVRFLISRDRPIRR